MFQAQPVSRFLSTPSELRSAKPSEGGSRIIVHKGREGLNLDRIRGSVSLAPHTLAAPVGSLSLWLLSLEDLGVAAQYPTHKQQIPHSCLFPILSDAPCIQFDALSAAFSLAFETHWHPQFYARWGRENFYQTFQHDPPIATVPVSHLPLKALHWYQIVVTWDEPANDYRIFVNGILAGTSDRNAPKLARHPVQPNAYIGHPAYAYSDIGFYDVALNGEQVADLYQRECKEADPELDRSLREIYAGAAKPFEYSPGEEWKCRMDVPCDSEKDLDAFDVQGLLSAPRIENEALRITTPARYFRHAPHADCPDGMHVYLFSRERFEGDLYVEYEFNPLRAGGLSLLMTQISGMQREDEFQDYPRSKTDAMAYLCAGHLRNYHWEYYRDINDCRNDGASHVLVKNPFYHPLGYVCRPQPLARETWHRLQYLQEGNRIRCAVNGDVVIDVTDDPFNNNGPVFNSGQIAIRCMINTDLLVRKLRVFERPRFQLTVNR